MATGFVRCPATHFESDLRVLLLVSLLPDGHDAGTDVGRLSLQRLPADRLRRHGGRLVHHAGHARVGRLSAGLGFLY